MSAEGSRLYTPEILGLTLRLADYPWIEGLAMDGQARSPSCGSTLAIALDSDEEGTIRALGLRVQACAIGQASAALFADAAKGRSTTDIEQAMTAMGLWLAGEGPVPEWPRIGILSPALAYPGRHGAIMLPWKAAVQALSKRSPAR